jgi:glycerol-3-phosphate acyltransferase PlsY
MWVLEVNPEFGIISTARSLESFEFLLIGPGRLASRLPVMDFTVVPAMLGAYLIGSLDFAVVVARARGVDIYDVGSGNPGTSNVLRTMGRGAAVLTLLGDVLKGFIAAAIGYTVAGESGATAAGFLVVLGHCYPVFHRFKGGKGVATAAGMLLWIVPRGALVLIAVWVVLVALTRVASIGSLAVVVLTVPAAWYEGVGWVGLLWILAALLLVAYRHGGNIARLFGSGEHKVVTS